MKKNVLLILSLTLAFASSAWAGPRSWQQAKTIAQQEAAKIGITLDESSTSGAKANGQAAQTNASYYVFANSNDKGYVIVSGDDVMPDIVGYSTNGTFDESQLPDNYVAFLKAYAATVKAVQDGNEVAIANVKKAKQLRAAKTTVAVSPLLGKEGISWNQDAPYNLMCPQITDDQGTTRAASGCVATAMAQIMRYYKYPSATTTEIPAYITETQKIKMEAIPAGTEFDWDNMLATYEENGYTTAQGNAVAKLMLACGCSMTMNYGRSSGAGSYAANAFANYFGYNPYMIQNVDRGAFTIEEWIDIIDTELANERPIFYTGSSFTGGHAFVCDGSDGNGLYHINWGWGGFQDNYFDITILNPEKGGIGSGNDPNGYTCYNAMTIGITPDQDLRPGSVLNYAPISVMNYAEATKIEIPAFTLTKSTRKNANDTFSAMIYSCFYCNHGDNFTGMVGYGIKNNDGTYTCLVSQDLNDSPANKINTFTKTLSYAFPVGNTILYPIYKKEGEDTWKRCVALNIIPVMITASETEADANLAIQADVTFANDLYLNVPTTINVKLKSYLDEIYYGGAPIMMTNGITYVALGNLDVSLSPYGEKTVTTDVTPTLSGTFAISVIDFDYNSLWETQSVIVDEPSTPVFKLIGVETNADKTETENVNFLNEGTEYTMVVPKVNHDSITVTYSIQNNGTTPNTIPYAIFAVNTLDDNVYKASSKATRAEGNGATTKVSASFSPDGIGKNVMVYLAKYNEDTGVYNKLFDTDLPNNKYSIYNSTSYIECNAAKIFAYIAGDPTGISTISAGADDFVAGGNGVIVVKSSTAKHLNVYNLSGQKVAEVSLSAGEQQTIAVRPGIYIVDGTKVAVK